MAVIPDLDIELMQGHKVVVVPDPDSITVRGPEHILDTLRGIPTRHRSFKRMDENFKARIPLECPEYLETTQKRVVVEVTITGKPSSIFSLKHQRED